MTDEEDQVECDVFRVERILKLIYIGFVEFGIFYILYLFMNLQ